MSPRPNISGIQAWPTLFKSYYSFSYVTTPAQFVSVVKYLNNIT